MQPATVGAADRCLVAMATHNYDQRINARLSIKLLSVLMWQFTYSVTQRTLHRPLKYSEKWIKVAATCFLSTQIFRLNFFFFGLDDADSRSS